MDKELYAAMTELSKEVSDAMQNALDRSKDFLKKHIENDVYASPYSPKVYQPRHKNPSLGAPLSDMESYSDTLPIPIGGVTGNGLMLTSALTYLPKGSHRKKKWDTANGNELIGRIERKNPSYTWENPNNSIPERPFWQNFIDEMVQGGELERLFVDALKTKEPSAKADGNIEEEQSDRNY